MILRLVGPGHVVKQLQASEWSAQYLIASPKSSKLETKHDELKNDLVCMDSTNWLMRRLYGNVSINNRHPDQCDHAYTHCCRCRSACVKRFVVVLLDRDRRQDINYAQFRRLLKTLLIFSLTGCLLAPWKYLGLIIYYYMFNIITKLWKKTNIGVNLKSCYGLFKVTENGAV